MGVSKLDALIQRATARLERRRAKATGDPWSNSLFRDAAYLQDQLMMIRAAQRGVQATRGIRESRNLARTDLDMPNASERELDAAVQLRLK